jgi:hypothetical protein
MPKYKPVSVPSAAFVFCRYTIAILIWLSLILQNRVILFVVLGIFILSAVLRIKRAPLIVLYAYTVNKIIKSKEVILNEYAMRFAHTVGIVFSLISLGLLYFVNDLAGWIMVFLFALLKSVSALGFCPAAKLYDCATNGSCCMLAKKDV